MAGLEQIKDLLDTLIVNVGNYYEELYMRRDKQKTIELTNKISESKSKLLEAIEGLNNND